MWSLLLKILGHYEVPSLCQLIVLSLLSSSSSGYRFIFLSHLSLCRKSWASQIEGAKRMSSTGFHLWKSLSIRLMSLDSVVAEKGLWIVLMTEKYKYIYIYNFILYIIYIILPYFCVSLLNFIFPTTPPSPFFYHLLSPPYQLILWFPSTTITTKISPLRDSYRKWLNKIY